MRVHAERWQRRWMMGWVALTCALSGRRPVAEQVFFNGRLTGSQGSFESGLPLGVVAEAEHVSCTFTLEPGDTLTFLSDGVVEAQQFGQQDDITVLTLTLIGSEVAHA